MQLHKLQSYSWFTNILLTNSSRTWSVQSFWDSLPISGLAEVSMERVIPSNISQADTDTSLVVNSCVWHQSHNTWHKRLQHISSWPVS